jgi:hypothetical protein
MLYIKSNRLVSMIYEWRRWACFYLLKKSNFHTTLWLSWATINSSIYAMNFVSRTLGFIPLIFLTVLSRQPLSVNNQPHAIPAPTSPQSFSQIPHAPVRVAGSWSVGSSYVSLLSLSQPWSSSPLSHAPHLCYLWYSTWELLIWRSLHLNGGNAWSASVNGPHLARPDSMTSWFPLFFL